MTLEGYVHRGRVTTIGVTDSLKYPGTNSFEGFAFPSALPRDRLDELTGLASASCPALGFDDGFFNMELFVPATGPAKLIEVNGAHRVAVRAARAERVQGRSTYEALVRLACGEDPAWQADGRDGVAISYCLRVFEDAFVVGGAGAGEGVEILVAAGPQPLRAGDERRGELPAGDLPRVGRDEGGGARALPGPGRRSSSTSCPRGRSLRRPAAMAEPAQSGTAAEIVFSGVTKRYPGRTAAAVEDLSLVVPAGEICVPRRPVRRRARRRR